MLRSKITFTAPQLRIIKGPTLAEKENMFVAYYMQNCPLYFKYSQSLELGSSRPAK